MLLETLHVIGATVVAIENLKEGYETDKILIELPSVIEGLKPIKLEFENVSGTLYNRG